MNQPPGVFTVDHILYRLLDQQGDTLYIGITNDLAVRMKHHTAMKWWWPEVADCKVEFHSSREELERAEVAAIGQGRPRHNVMHNRPTSRLRPDGFTEDEWAWLHFLPPYKHCAVEAGDIVTVGPVREHLGRVIS